MCQATAKNKKNKKYLSFIYYLYKETFFERYKI